MENAEIRPLKTLEEVLSWCPDPRVEFQTVPLTPRIREAGEPRLLVCHDMQGGYLQDRFVRGSKTCEGYRFFHWHYVDTFVYFSHCLVTVPPVGWINASHRHGVKVLGTIITEWEDGYEICKELLSCPDKCALFVRKLSDICRHFNFDGWLVNIENKIQEELVARMEGLLRSLKESLEVSTSGSLVIWYDSVISTGELKWQNELNDNNRKFFEACDGIFLNYNWEDDHLERSLQAAGDSRLLDVYVGVDVFGRGCLGGGGFNTSQAVAAINKFGLSVALFAPGWVMEVHGWHDFLSNQHRYWDMLSKYLRSSCYSCLPIRTSFCQGYGHKVFKRGRCIDEGPWYNLSAQQLQPTYLSSCLARIHTEDAFNGGGCLRVSGTIPSGLQHQNIKLLETKISGDSDWLASVTWKTLAAGETHEFALQLSFKDPQACDVFYLLTCSPSLKAMGARERLLVPTKDEKPTDNWNTRMFVVEEKDIGNHLLTEIGVRVCRRTDVKDDQAATFDLLLGEIQVVSLSKEKESKPDLLAVP